MLFSVLCRANARFYVCNGTITVAIELESHLRSVSWDCISLANLYIYHHCEFRVFGHFCSIEEAHRGRLLSVIHGSLSDDHVVLQDA